MSLPVEADEAPTVRRMGDGVTLGLWAGGAVAATRDLARELGMWSPQPSARAGETRTAYAPRRVLRLTAKGRPVFPPGYGFTAAGFRLPAHVTAAAPESYHNTRRHPC